MACTTTWTMTTILMTPTIMSHKRGRWSIDKFVVICETLRMYLYRSATAHRTDILLSSLGTMQTYYTHTSHTFVMLPYRNTSWQTILTVIFNPVPRFRHQLHRRCAATEPASDATLGHLRDQICLCTMMSTRCCAAT